VIANWPGKRIHHWVRSLPARAIGNQTCAVGVNCVGHDPQQIRSGRSIIVGFHGKILVISSQ
jgi:predicted amidohydrolase